MIQRIVVAVIGLGVLVPLIVFGGELAVEILVPIVMLLCIDEYARMAFPDARGVGVAAMTAGIAVPYGVGLYLGDAWLLPLSGLAIVAAMTAMVVRPGADLTRAADALGRWTLGVAWFGGTFVFLPLLRRLDDGLAWVFLAMAVAWMSDTGGYFAGRFFGRTPLHKVVSPKKTVEGLIGGLAAATAGVAVARAVALPALSWLDVLVIGVGIGALGVAGDLAESLLKRAYGVKDSGTLLPGHGGLLDRIDALMFVCAGLYGYVVLKLGYG